MRAFRRDVVASLAAGLAAALLLMAGARWALPRTIDGPVGEGAWTARSRAAFVPSGFFPAEFDSTASRHFSWTRASSQIRLPGLDRSHPVRLVVRLRAGRPPGTPLPSVRTTVDGAAPSVFELSNDPRVLVIVIPAAQTTGADVAMDISDTWSPGGQDTRDLGVMVDGVGVQSADGHFRVGARVWWRLGLAVALCVLGVRLCGLSGGPAAATTLATVLALPWLLLQDGAFLGVYVDRLVTVGALAASAGVLVALVRARWPVIAGVPDWAAAFGIVLAISAVKLSLFWHPLAIVGDAIFQVHRAQLVHSGSYFFTSITPRPFFEFPYPVALYVTAQPFWAWFPTELDLVRLLRAVALGADALVGVALYGAMRRQWNDRATALACAALWPFAQAPFEALSNANLTNLFGQGVFGVAMGVLAWIAAATRFRAAALAGACALLVVAFLSHFGTLTVGLVVLGVVAAMLMTLGRAHVRRAGVWICALTIAAAAMSWVTYYSHFTDVYRKTYASVVARQTDDSSKIVAAPSVKLQRWWSGTGDDYGLPSVPVMLIAAIGAAVAVRRRGRDGVTLVLLGWMLAWVALSALGVLTAITLRANLAAAPAFIALCAVAIGALGQRSRTGAVLATVLGVVVAWGGLQVALACLGLDPRWPTGP